MLLMGKSTISMAIFNSYVSLPEGIVNGWCSCQALFASYEIPQFVERKICRKPL